MATDGLPTTTYAVLGLLSWGPLSPYGVWQIAEGSIAHFWTISKSQVYGEVARIEELGFAEAEDVTQEGLPDKRIFRLTDAGSQALDAWLGDPTHEPDRFRSGFLVKVFFGNRMPQDVFRSMMSGYRNEARSGVEELRRAVDNLEDAKGLEHARLTAQLGLAVAQAALAWAEEALEDLEGAEKT